MRGDPGSLSTAPWDDLEGLDFIVDLSMGAWRARDVALQLAEATDAVLPPVEQLHQDDDPEIIAQGVDAEARGSLPVLVAVQDALALSQALAPASSIGVLCASPQGLADENLWTLVFLRRLGHRITRLVPPAGERQREDLIAGLDEEQRHMLLFPGPLPLDLAAKSGLSGSANVFLPRFPHVVRPQLRLALPDIRPGLLAPLARFDAEDARIRLMTQILGPAYYADAEWLTDTGMQLLRLGAHRLALCALKRACDIASDTMVRARAELNLQGVRIFAHLFADASAHPDSGTALPAAVREQLTLLRGWSEIAGADPSRGLQRIACTMRAAEAATPKSVNDLFVLNIAALGHLRSGEIEMALDTERLIEKELTSSGDRIDYRAEFINALNLSRLYRRSGETERYRQQLDRALATSEGLRNLSDIIQMNLMRAEAGGSEDEPASHVLRAVLAWLALSPPEAIAARALRQTGANPTEAAAIDGTVCEALLARLEAAFPGLVPGRPAGAVAVEGCVPRGSAVFATRAAALLLLPESGWRPGLSPASTARSRLNALALAALEIDCPALCSHPAPLIGVDTDFGTDIPCGWSGLIRLAVLHGLERCLWRDRRFELAATDQDHLPLSASVTLSRGVAGLESVTSGVRVFFKRYRRPATLTGAESVFLRQVEASPGRTVEVASRAIGLDPVAGAFIAASLQKRRVLRLEYSLCMMDGIRSPSLAMSAHL
ncbi:hypothetical protein [Rhizobium sp. FY34]|uniref:hypothetical protein n=1 Tax=Rhizobium sp. FY34 TaxID=2562309 RepID=UPI0010C0185E|nr:hypothetical protein [Rhizobium sp. FY34]